MGWRNFAFDAFVNRNHNLVYVFVVVIPCYTVGTDDTLCNDGDGGSDNDSIRDVMMTVMMVMYDVMCVCVCV